MARKPTERGVGSKPKPKSNQQNEDTALLCLSPTDRQKLNMDAWEPSLLRQLLAAQNRLRRRD